MTMELRLGCSHVICPQLKAYRVTDKANLYIASHRSTIWGYLGRFGKVIRPSRLIWGGSDAEMPGDAQDAGLHRSLRSSGCEWPSGLVKE